MNEHGRKMSLQSLCAEGLTYRLSIRCLRFAVLMMFVSAVQPAIVPPAFAADGQYIANNTPAFVSSATNQGRESASSTIEVSIWLRLHNRSALDALAQDLYRPSSPSYRQWLKSSEVVARFAPTAAEAKTVQDFFASNNLKVVRTGPNNSYVRARGTVGDVENAFHVQINEYQVGNQTLRANATNPYIEGPAATLVQGAVSGLDNVEFEHALEVKPSSLTSSSTSNRANFSPRSFCG